MGNCSLGMGIANGEYVVVIIETIVVLTSLLFLTILEKWLDNVTKAAVIKL